MSLKLYRPTPDGGMEPAPPEAEDYRTQLRSRRWNAARLENTEARKTDPRLAILLIGALCVGTFVILVLGYASGFWG